jgi:hypothetical protein
METIQKLKIEKDNLDAELQRISIKSTEKTKFEAICAERNTSVDEAIRSFVTAVNEGEIELVIDQD